MQVAALRVCLAEHAALDSFEHPVWRLLDRIGETSRRLPAHRGSAPSTLPRVRRRRRRGDGGAAAPDAALFRRGLNRIDSFLAEQLQAQLRAAQADVEALQLAERREVLSSTWRSG